MVHTWRLRAEQHSPSPSPPETQTLTQPPSPAHRLDNHYQWVIFLVIMIVAIVGIWVGACVWRRRYLRRKDRAYALGTNLAHTTPSGRVAPNDSNAGSVHVPQPGMFDPAPISTAGVYGEKAAEQPAGSKKKWLVRGDRS